MHRLHECDKYNLVVRLNIRNFEADYEKSENDIKALQSVGQIVGEVTRQLDEERCKAAFLACSARPHRRPSQSSQSLSRHLLDPAM